MARVNIILPDDQLERFDREAEQEGLSRSRLIQKAMEDYLGKVEREQEEAKRRAQMEEACRTMDKLAEKAGSWDPVAVLRFYRDTRYGPDWWKTRTNPEYAQKKRRRAG